MFAILTQLFPFLTYKFYENVGINKNLYIFGQPIWSTNLVNQFGLPIKKGQVCAYPF